MSETTPEITIPAELLPADGRFGSGPSKVRPEAVAALAEIADDYLGTSHRQPTVKNVVGRLREGMSDFFGLPDDWEIVLGNGGTTMFWDCATFGLIRNRSQHLSFGEFSGKFASAVSSAPFLADPMVIESELGTKPEAVTTDGIDLYALTHNETTTGVSMEIKRPAGSDGLVAVDATSAAGGLRWDPAEVDCYYFAPQKAFASDGGLYIAACSPAAQDRIKELASGYRWCPPALNLKTALDNSTKNQTYNTPALATIHMAVSQVEWFNQNGGIDFAAGRSEESAQTIYSWADASALATPFVTKAEDRSNVVATIDFDDSISADVLSKVLRANGILDTEGYRKLGRNQVRIALFPAIDPSDIEALTKCIDFVLAELA